jgi:hypothetical protein
VAIATSRDRLNALLIGVASLLLFGCYSYTKRIIWLATETAVVGW